jgi:K+-transporting ATPase ATPase A chain
MFDIPTNDLLQLFLFILTLLILAKPLGFHIAKVYAGEKTLLTPIFQGLENLIYKICAIDKTKKMGWREYAASIIIFSLLGFLILFVMLLTQNLLPLNPQNLQGLSWHLAFNTAISFITNTNWQSYGGETTMSYFSQMVGLTVQNFVSAATGIAVLIALIRGFTAKNQSEIGNFWVDLIRGNLYILLPLSILLAPILVSQGVVQTFASYVEVTTLEGTKQTIAVGPAASQIAIKQLGTNGGGFFNVNSAHPFENPTPISNFIEMLAILLIPTALCFTFGIMIKEKKQGRSLLIAMFAIFIPLLMICYYAELAGNTKINELIANSQSNMEGKEVRFGIMNSALWASATTAASNGSVNSMHASYTPIGSMIPLIFMQLGEVIFGGVGSGLYGMIIFAIITVFIAGLMIGRTPEYLGKKIQSFEIKMACIVIIAPAAAILIGVSIAVLTDIGKSSILNPNATGFTEILYAFSSAANNNGSAFAGLNANTPFYNTALGICMIIGRFFVMIPTLAIAGNLAKQNIIPVTNGTLPTDNWLFILMLVAIIFLVGFLTFVPALVLGPIIDQFYMISR